MCLSICTRFHPQSYIDLYIHKTSRHHKHMWNKKLTLKMTSNYYAIANLIT
jgi:hypothetical protein